MLGFLFSPVVAEATGDEPPEPKQSSGLSTMLKILFWIVVSMFVLCVAGIILLFSQQHAYNVQFQAQVQEAKDHIERIKNRATVASVRDMVDYLDSLMQANSITYEELGISPSDHWDWEFKGESSAAREALRNAIFFREYPDNLLSYLQKARRHATWDNTDFWLVTIASEADMSDYLSELLLLERIYKAEETVTVEINGSPFRWVFFPGKRCVRFSYDTERTDLYNYNGENKETPVWKIHGYVPYSRGITAVIESDQFREVSIPYDEDFLDFVQRKCLEWGHCSQEDAKKVETPEPEKKTQGGGDILGYYDDETIIGPGQHMIGD